MGEGLSLGRSTPSEFGRHDITGAIGDAVTVLPIVVAVAVLTELSLAMMLIWFGVFQIAWGYFYGVPISVEPMKALAALVLAGTITTGEFLLAGVLVGGVLLAMGVTKTLGTVGRYIGSPVIRGVQFGVALVLLDTGIRLGFDDVQLAAVALGVAIVLIAIGYWNLTALLVLLVGGIFAVVQVGVPTPAVPTTDGLWLLTPASVTIPALEATLAQLAMSIGNAALAASVLLYDYFDRDISPDQLSNSMGVMNLVAVPLGAFPMCHGSGGIAGKYAFGARTAGANVVLGLAYIVVAIIAVGLVAAYPVAMLGVILALIAIQLGKTSLEETTAYAFVIGMGVLGLIVNLAVAFVIGVIVYLILVRRGPV